MCPNKTDPMFVQLRVKHVPQDLTADLLKVRLTTIYNQIAGCIEMYLSQAYGDAPIDSSTSIKDLAGSIVIIMDKSGNNKDFAKLSPSLNHRVHLTNDNINLFKKNLTDIENEDPIMVNTLEDGITTDAVGITEIVPTNANNGFEYHIMDNTDSLNMLINYSANICPMQFWSNGPELRAYETIFNKGKAGILPISDAISYAHQQSVIPVINYP
jgi:hypothetical protein